VKASLQENCGEVMQNLEALLVNDLTAEDRKGKPQMAAKR